LGFIDYHGGDDLQVHSLLLNIVLHDRRCIRRILFWAFSQVGKCGCLVGSEGTVILRKSLLVAVLVFLLVTVGCIGKPELQDVSPESANGSPQASPSSAGLTVSLAGNSSRLYAVSLNAGVWRSDGSDHAWEQLHNSPPRAYSIASDPNNNLHLAVGEREDDQSDSTKRQSGLWESSDGGSTWTYVLNPVSQLGCSTQAIPSVAFSPTGILFAATSCGVARRDPRSQQFQIASNTAGAGGITAVTVSPHGTWARSSNALLIADASGQLWVTKAMPKFAIAAQGSTGDPFSLAATDKFAYFTCCSTSLPPNCSDPANPGTFGTLNAMLIYNLALDTWKLQPSLPTVQNTPGIGCDGTGLGGSRFVRIFSSPVNHPGIPTLQFVRLFYSSAQDIYEATGFAGDGSATGWTKILASLNGDNVHTDFWDFLLDTQTAQMWIANDGGVSERKSLDAGTTWTTRVQGLHTHHIHTLTLIGAGTMPAPAIAYPTSDNDAWYSTLLSSPAAWHTSSLGDVNWSAGDAANPHSALVVRQPGSFAAFVQDSSPYVTRITLRQDPSFDGPGSFHFIQTLAKESVPDTTQDAVMLTTLPLRYIDPADKTMKGVPGDLGDATQAGRVVILRNRHFEVAPDINISKGVGWGVEADVPEGTTRFWVTGGHDNPLYFVLAIQRKLPKLFKENGWANGKVQWQELNVQGKLSDPQPYPFSNIPGDSLLYKGPIFVNPYNRDEIFVLTASGVRASKNGGSSFEPDAALTALVSGGNAYPIGSGFPGGDSSGVRIANRSSRNAMGALADVAFLRDNPDIAVACSPFTGLFYRSSGKWLDLSSFLISPKTPISSVAIDPSTIYFATEGRGLFRLIGYDRAGFYLWAKSLLERTRI
jgi:hypothetical protein